MTESRNGYSRRDVLQTGLRAGAALGVAGLGGLTVLDQAAAQDRMPWDDLPEGQSAPATALQLRTIGLGVSVQDRFLREFERRSGHKAIGKVAGLTPMITEWLAGGYRSYDTNETNANRNAALWNAGLLQAIPVDKVAPWKDARDLYTSDKALGHDRESGWPLAEIWVDPASQKEFKLVPQFFNCDSIGYRYDLTGEDVTSWGALFDPKYKGKVAIFNDSLLTPGWCAGFMKKNGLADIKRTGNMTHAEVDAVINFMIEKKKEGQFRAIWEDYGQAVNLLASGEVWLADCWNPVVEDVKKQGVVCKYAFPKEGFTAWFHGVAVAKDTPNLDAAIAYVNFCLEGWWGAQVAPQGYYSPTTTCEKYLKTSKKSDPQGEFNDYQWWYEGGASEDPKAGWPIRGRDTGSFAKRWSNIMHWMVWPDDPDYYAERWNDFLTA